MQKGKDAVRTKLHFAFSFFPIGNCAAWGNFLLHPLKYAGNKTDIISRKCRAEILFQPVF